MEDAEGEPVSPPGRSPSIAGSSTTKQSSRRNDAPGTFSPSSPKRRDMEGVSKTSIYLPIELLSMPDDLVKLEWVQHATDRWYMLYQPTFPILDDSSNLDLTYNHPLLRSALLLAMYSLVWRSRTPKKVDALLAEQLLTQYTAQCRPENMDMADRLTFLQVIMMLAIEADQRGNEVAGSIRTIGYWLGQATAVAYGLRLHNNDTRLDTPEQQLLGKRLFLILVVLDRWHSVSTSSPPFIAEATARFDIELHLSGITNHLYRLSIIVGHVYAYIMSPQDHGGSPSSGTNTDLVLSAQILKAEIEEWRAKVDVIWGQSNLLHIAYWHVCILALLGTKCTSTSEILELKEMAMRLASTLPNSATPYTPLNHHFYTLTTCVLSHLLQFEKTRADARKGLRNLREAVERHRDLIAEDDASWDCKLLQVNAELQGSHIHPSDPKVSRNSLLEHIRHEGYLRSLDSII